MKEEKRTVVHSDGEIISNLRAAYKRLKGEMKGDYSTAGNLEGGRL